MRIDQEKCVGCERCVSYCPVGAIHVRKDGGKTKKRSWIDEDECVECGVCLRANVCKPEAIYLPELGWPRIVRRAFSDPMVEHKETGVPGRGTEEMKTNEVTGRFKRGSWGMAVEVGRPGVGARLKDLETIAMALAEKGILFEPKNPVMFLFEDPKTGKLKPELREEKVLSAIIEFVVKPHQLKDVFEVLRKASERVETVFSVDLISFPDEKEFALGVAREMGFPVYPNGKVNLGLGRVLNR
ncbi:MAG: 4Fe-4S binding protein [Syntrophaceae bacterium]|nr:4Fe-4S binding protein [Syntrophaceae bacterium]